MKVERQTWIGALVTAWVMMVAVGSGSVARADDVAEELLHKAALATQSLHALSAEYTNTISNGRGPYYGWTNSLKLLKPNYCRLDIASTGPAKPAAAATAKVSPETEVSVLVPRPAGERFPAGWLTTDSAVVVSDGKTKWQYGYRRNDYKTSPVDRSGKVLNLVDVRPMIDFFDLSKSWWAEVQTLRKEGRLKELSIAGKESWEGAEYQVVQLVFTPDTFYTEAQLKAVPGGVVLKTQRFYVGADYLVHRVTEQGNVGLSFDYQLHGVKIDPDLKPSDFAYAPPATAKPATPPPPLLSPGTLAPDFVAIAPDGSTVKLADYRGKIVVLDFWATWCQPCQKAFPHLRKVYDSVHNQDVVFLGLCVWDDRPAFDSWVTKNRVTYPFLFGFDPSARVAESSIPRKLYSVNGIPATFVLDKTGKISSSFDDYIEGDHRLEAALRKLQVQVPDL